MANVQRNLAVFRGALINRLDNAGFPAVNNRRMKKRLLNEGFWKKNSPTGIVQKGETIFNRGIRSKKSSFFVFLKSEPSKNQVTVYYYNPDSGSDAPMRRKGSNGKTLSGEEYLIRKVYRGTSDPVAASDRILKDIFHYASLKPLNEYRMESHLHCGWMPKGYRHTRKFRDDGVSHANNVLRVNGLYDRDVISFTSHNSFDRKKFWALEIIAEEMGMIMVPGMELTAPGNVPNGPHLLLWFSDFMAAHEGELIAAKRRSDFAMPPFNDDVVLHKVLPLLYNRLSRRGELIIGAAHPFNMHEPDHPIYDVGMVSTMETGPYKYNSINALFEYVHAIEVWNASLSVGHTLPHLKNRSLQRMVDNLINNLSSDMGRELGPTANAVSFSLPNIFGVPFECFGTDDHTTPSMNYVSDGLPQAWGHTIIDLGHIYATLPNKPTAKELVQMLHHGLISMEAHVFQEVRDGRIQVPKGRTRMNRWTKKLRRNLQDKANRAYLRATLKDIARFELDAEELGNVVDSYFG
ncbi:hypothetical protein GF412_04170 [Candidatus Micrarchaeota archaeon]|nr:hypothetical protein [Candidatus Micrarchaeota archaeon]MBD3418146.1 hypothetical protein [Candidatus Micrarchaeota archaeon]